jgi:hypothetical protein
MEGDDWIGKARVTGTHLGSAPRFHVYRLWLDPQTARVVAHRRPRNWAAVCSLRCTTACRCATAGRGWTPPYGKEPILMCGSSSSSRRRRFSIWRSARAVEPRRGATRWWRVHPSVDTCTSKGGPRWHRHLLCLLLNRVVRSVAAQRKERSRRRMS